VPKPREMYEEPERWRQRAEETLPVNEWLLDVKRVGITEYVSPYVLETLTAEAVRDVVFDRMLVRLQARVLAHDVRAYDVTEHDRVPASWWDHYKHTLWTSVVDKPGWQARADRWIFRRLRLDRVAWRTLTATLHVQEFVVYPEADPALARTLGPGVPQRIITHSWPIRFDSPPGGDTDV
jgi:hypothetical protein